MSKFFFDPDNNPRPEGWVALVMAFATAYYLFNYKKPRKEVTMMEFINDFVLRDKVKEIFVTKDPRSEVFNFRAEFNTHDGEKYYMILNSYDEFL